MLKNLFRKKGLIITEALLAVALLAIGAVVLGSILNSAITTSAISKNYLIGENIATEGLEAVKNLRDSNWMVSPNNSSAWLCLIPKIGCASGLPANDTNYLPIFEGKWYLKGAGTIPLDIENWTLSQQQVYGLWLQNGQYTHTPVSGTNPSFYRRILFTNLTATSATVNVKVQWWEGSTARTIERHITLYNY